MPRPTRHVAHANSPSKLLLNDDQNEKFQRRQNAPVQSPVRKMGRNAQRRARDSDVSSVMSDDEPSSPGTPYAQTPDNRAKSGKYGKVAGGTTKHNLQKQAMHNRRSMSGTHTPRQVPLRDEESVPSNLQVVGTSLTPASKKPIPILSNFEDWLKLATDNKINATNSWNFALIDYFHEMSLLRDEGGKGINFQKASCTLDGCVKIYSSRVESVGVEAGRLLSGLATSGTDEDGKKKKKRGEDGEDEEEGSDVEGEESDGEGGKKKKEKKRKQRSHEATLAPSFASLQLKKLELEFAVDPLFKKASADFDEGGAKGLLLNHLSINEEGRIVFDSSDDATDMESKKKSVAEEEEDGEEESSKHDPADAEEATSQSQDQPQEHPEYPEDVEIDLTSLANKFFPDLSLLDQLDICPSMKNFKLGDPTAALSIPLLNADNNDWKTKNPSPEKGAAPPPQIDGELNLADQSGLFLDGSHGLDFDNDDDDAIGLGGFDMNMDDGEIGFGQGGEAWAREAAVEPMLRPANAEDDEQQDDGDGYAVNMQHRYREDIEQETMLAFFGKAVNSRAKPGSKAFQTIANWRIAKIQNAAAAENAPPQRTRKEKEPLKIDFHGPISDNLKKLLGEKPVSNDKISLPKTQLKTKGRNLLDKDDELIDVKSMMRLWTKPKCRVSRNRRVIDEGFGARGRSEAPRMGLDDKPDDDEDDADTPQGDYDANFFADDEPLGLPFDGPLPIDDDDDDDEGGEQPGFVDAREMLSPPPDGAPAVQSIEDVLEGQEPPDAQVPMASQTEANMLPGSFGSQLVTQQGRRLRPEYVNYARTAKKVDVRALKENMWKGMHVRLNVFSAPEEKVPSLPAMDVDADGDSEMMDADAPVTPPAQEELRKNDGEVLKFTDILGGLKSVYPETQMKDISTSYGFICLLHLANEKGLVLEGGREEGAMEEILVRKDAAVGEGYVGE